MKLLYPTSCILFSFFNNIKLIFLIIIIIQGASSVLQYYNGNWMIALSSLFPSLSLDVLKFHHYPSIDISLFISFFLSSFLFCQLICISASYWQNVENKRWIFVEFSKQLSFDYSVAENWYPHLRNIYSYKVFLYNKKNVYV